MPGLPAARLHAMVWVVLAGVFVPWVMGGAIIAGFNVTGWSWVIPTTFSALVLLAGLHRVALPLGPWIPWAVVAIANCLLRGDGPGALQTTVQMLAPLIVGCAASTLRWGDDRVRALLSVLDRCVLVIMLLLVVRLPGLLSGKLIDHSYMAAEAISVLLFGSIYATRYALGSRFHLGCYVALCLMPLAVLTRGVMAALSLAVVLTPGPLGMRRRLLFLTLLIVAAVFALQSDRIQQRMFHSGGGSWQDMSLANPDFATSGRVPMWETLWVRVGESPWIGHGVNASRSRLGWAGFDLYLPHNDWLRVLHDFGIIGVGTLAFGMAATGLALVRRASREAPSTRVLAYCAAGGFLPLALIMLTDNPLLYVQFYGNLHFLLVGAAFSCCRQVGGAQSFLRLSVRA